MKKQVLFLFCFLVINSLFSQTSFEKGYFVNNEGNKVECLIKNLNWLNPPKQVQYKSDENAEVQSFDVENVSEFRVDGGPLYKRVKADFPKTHQFLKEKGVEPQPELVNKTVFVKRILNGSASLYEFSGDKDRVFLIQIGGGELLPLLYKQYDVDINAITENNIFRRQLLKNLSCDSTDNIQTVNYNAASLVSFVASYNKCVDPSATEGLAEEESAKKKIKTKVAVFAGIVSYGFETVLNSNNVTFEGKISPSFGLEIEAILPFNNNKWSAFLSAQYASYSAEGTAVVNSVPTNAGSIELNQLILNVGGRHYMFLNDRSSFHLELGAVIDFNFKGELEQEPGFETALRGILPVNFGGFGGFGYSYNQKFYITAKYLLNTSIIEDVQFANDLKRFIVSAKYKF